MKHKILMASLLVLAILPLALHAAVPIVGHMNIANAALDAGDSGGGSGGVSYCNQQAPSLGHLIFSSECIGVGSSIDTAGP